MSQDRRNFLKHIGTGAAAVAAVSTAATKVAHAGPADGSFAALASPGADQIKISLDLDGSFAGWLFSSEGGGATSDVVTEKVGADHVIKKHVAGVKYEDITVTCGTGMSKAFYEWIKASFDGRADRHSGVIAVADKRTDSTSILAFQNAFISEIGMPALDAGSKDAAKMTIKFAPEYTRKKLASGQLNKSDPTPIQKKWLPANFRLKIDGLEEPCKRIASIDSFTWKLTPDTVAVDDSGKPIKVPGRIEVPDLAFSLPEVDGVPFDSWLEDFVIKGNNGDDKERSGSLQFLAANGKDMLFEVDFFHLGIFKCNPDKAEAGSESIRRVKVEMYCEQMEFEYSSASTWM